MKLFVVFLETTPLAIVIHIHYTTKHFSPNAFSGDPFRQHGLHVFIELFFAILSLQHVLQSK